MPSAEHKPHQELEEALRLALSLDDDSSPPSWRPPRAMTGKIARALLILQAGGAGLIATERQRQIESEGWTPDHDDDYLNGELVDAALRYAATENDRDFYGLRWPWDSKWWKPTPKDRVRELTKAGALIAAEIDRLQRLS